MCIKYAKIGSPKDKLEWIFKIFDVDGGGTITYEELRSVSTKERAGSYSLSWEGIIANNNKPLNSSFSSNHL